MLRHYPYSTKDIFLHYSKFWKILALVDSNHIQMIRTIVTFLSKHCLTKLSDTLILKILLDNECIRYDFFDESNLYQALKNNF